MSDDTRALKMIALYDWLTYHNSFDYTAQDIARSFNGRKHDPRTINEWLNTMLENNMVIRTRYINGSIAWQTPEWVVRGNRYTEREAWLADYKQQGLPDLNTKERIKLG